MHWVKAKIFALGLLAGIVPASAFAQTCADAPASSNDTSCANTRWVRANSPAGSGNVMAPTTSPASGNVVTFQDTTGRQLAVGIPLGTTGNTIPLNEQSNEFTALNLNGGLAPNSGGVSTLQVMGTQSSTGGNARGINVSTVFTPTGGATAVFGEFIGVHLGVASSNVSNYEAIGKALTLDSGYTGTAPNITMDEDMSFTNNSSAVPANVIGKQVDDISSSLNGVTSGGHAIKQFSCFAPMAAGAGNGGTLNEYCFYAQVPGGGAVPGGINNDYGIYIAGNGGGSGSNSYALYSASTAASQITGFTAIGPPAGSTNLVLQTNGDTLVKGRVGTNTYTVGSLPTSGNIVGDRVSVTDATACTGGSSLTGGASTYCSVAWNGSAWVGEGGAGGGGSSGGNPTATAGPNAVNGSASTFLRSDGAPAIQKASNAQFGLVQADGTSLTCTSGVCSGISALFTGTMTNSGNTYSVSTTVPSGFALTNGFVVRAAVSATNTGSATLNVAGTGATTVETNSPTVAALVGGEMQLATVADFTYNSTCTCFILSNLPQAASVVGTPGTVTAAQWAINTKFVPNSSGGTYTLPASSGLTGLGGISINTELDSVTVTANAADAINGGSTGGSIVLPQGIVAQVIKSSSGNITIAPTSLGSFTVESAVQTCGSTYQIGGTDVSHAVPFDCPAGGTVTVPAVSTTGVAALSAFGIANYPDSGTLTVQPVTSSGVTFVGEATNGSNQLLVPPNATAWCNAPSSGNAYTCKVSPGVSSIPPGSNLVVGGPAVNGTNWTTSHAALTTGQTGPWGDTNATKMVDDATNNAHYITQAFNGGSGGTAGVTYQYSALLKPVGSNNYAYIAIQSGGSTETYGVEFNIASGCAWNETGDNYGSFPLGNILAWDAHPLPSNTSWCQVSLTFNAGANGNIASGGINPVEALIYTCSTSASIPCGYTGTGSNGLLVENPQIIQLTAASPQGKGAPTIGTCGTGSVIYGHDDAFIIETGTGTVTSCSLTFQAGDWGNSPICAAPTVYGVNVVAYWNAVPTSSGGTITLASSEPSQEIAVICKP